MSKSFWQGVTFMVVALLVAMLLPAPMFAGLEWLRVHASGSVVDAIKWWYRYWGNL